LAIIDGDHEQTVPAGRIDITARDKDGSTVVIELKAGLADRDVIGQIQSYMGDPTDGAARVRGIVVAREFSSRAIAAARPAGKIRLVRYGFRFHSRWFRQNRPLRVHRCKIFMSTTPGVWVPRDRIWCGQKRDSPHRRHLYPRRVDRPRSRRRFMLHLVDRRAVATINGRRVVVMLAIVVC